MAEKNQSKYPITISDWITFLESNASTNTNLFVFLGSGLIAITIALSSFNLVSSNSSITVIQLAIISIFMIFGLLIYSSKRAKKYQRLCQKIMNGRITDPEEIRKEYNKFRKKI